MAWVAPTLRITGELITAAIWNTDLVANLLILKTALDDSGNVSFPTPTTLTLASDACTPTLNLHKVDTEGAAASDNLSTLTISGTVRVGHLLRLTAANIARVVTVKDSVGNIVLKMGDFKLDATDRWIELMFVGTTWYEQGRSDLRGAELTAYRETKTAPAISANVLTLDLALGNHFAVALNANITTLTISNPAASGKVSAFFVYFTADGTARTITWPAAVKWAYGVAPTPTSTNNKVDVYYFETHDGGTTYFASIVGQNY